MHLKVHIHRSFEWLLLHVMWIAGAASLEQVLTTIIHGALELVDPVGQKICFAVLRKLVEVWGG